MSTDLQTSGTILKKVLFSILLLLSTIGISYSQQCGQCSYPRIIFYDCTIQVPRPTIQDSLSSWWALAWPAFWAHTSIVNDDETGGCISYIDRGSTFSLLSHGDTYLSDVDYANLPPSGAINSADYIFVSYVSGSNGNYTLTLQLQTAVSREVVKSISENFTGDPASREPAGEAAASAFLPLIQTIWNYEVNKRNTDVTVAMCDVKYQMPNIVTVTPEKTKVDTGETINVNVEMYDCDGAPLGNRTIYFTDTTVNGLSLKGTTGGKMNPSVVTTDSHGKASVQFTTTQNMGYSHIVAWYPHKKPCGRAGSFMGTADVLTKMAGKNIWVVQGSISSQTITTGDTNVTYVAGYSTYQRDYQDNASASFIAFFYVDNGSDTTISLADYQEDDPEFKITISGSEQQDLFYKTDVEAEGVTPDVYIKTEHTVGQLFDYSDTGFEFYYPADPSSTAVGFICGGQGQCTGNIKKTDTNPQFHWDDDSYSVESDCSISGYFNGNECTMTRNGNSYSVTGDQTHVEHEYEGADQGTQITKVYNHITAKIWLYDSTATAIHQLKGLLPFTNKLLQNFPNPFNPETNIGYQLASNSFVTLKVYDILGREVATLVNQRQNAGDHSIMFNTSKYSSGVYFYRIQAIENSSKNFTSIKKLMVLK